MINGTEALDFVKNNMKILSKGSALIDSDGNILYLLGVVLGKEGVAFNDCVDYDMEQLNELNEYINPLQAKLDELQTTVDRLTADLILAHAPKPKGKYNHLSVAEVKEIEDIFIEKPTISRDLICNTYSSSQPVISRIAQGKHVKTSSSYQHYLMKKEL